MNHKEVMEALLAGKKVRYKDWLPGDFYHIVDGVIRDESGNKASTVISGDNVEIVEEPKPPRKLYAYRSQEGGVITFNEAEWAASYRAPEFDIVYKGEG